jgi:hypothetical protein
VSRFATVMPTWSKRRMRDMGCILQCSSCRSSPDTDPYGGFSIQGRLPLTVGTLADTTSLQAALVVVPVMLVLTAAGPTLVSRVLMRANGGVS